MTSRIVRWGVLIACVLASTSCRFASRVSAEVFANALLVEVKDPLGLQPPETACVVRVGLIEDATSDNPNIEPVVGADVLLESVDAGFNSIILSSAQTGEPGAYGASSQDTDLVYQVGAEYTVRITIPAGDHQGEYSLTVVAPEASNVTGFPDTVGGETIPVGEPLVLNIDPPDAYEHGLVVVAVDESGEPDVIYDNTPQSAGEWAKFLVGGFGGEVTIPEGERENPFQDAGRVYGVGVTGVVSSKGPQESANLHLLSEFLAGTMETALVCTAPACTLP